MRAIFQVLGIWVLFPLCLGAAELPFLPGLYLTTEEGDQMQLYSGNGRVTVYLFLKEEGLPLVTVVPDVADLPKQKVVWAEVGPLDQLYPVWKGAGAETEATNEGNGFIDLTEVSGGKAAAEVAGRRLLFKRVAEHRIFTIGMPREQGGIRTRAAFPVFYDEAWQRIPLDEDLAFFLVNRNGEIVRNHRQRLRSGRFAEHYVVVYPLELSLERAGFLAVERLYVGGAHGDYELKSFSYSQTETGWERKVWETEIWENAEWREQFETASLALAERLEDPIYSPQEQGWAAVPLTGQVQVKFGTYMITAFAGGMPEMFLNLEKPDPELHE